MKYILTAVLTVLITIVTFAQQGISYKALIKDDLGNVVSNQEVTIQFRILDALSGGNIEFQDTHNNVMTDTNGIAIVNIGEGVQSLAYVFFDDIDWGSHVRFLQTRIDINGGTNFTDMGTIQFMAVPYSKYAESAGNVSGLEKISETTNGAGDPAYGWRLMNVENGNYGDIGQWAVDLSRQQSESNIHGATGFASFATGLNTEASSGYSVAMGNNTIASRFAAVALGQYNVDDPLIAFAIGNGSSGGGRSNALTLTAYEDFIIGNSQIDDDPSDINDNTKFFFSGTKGALRAGRVSVQSGDEWNNVNMGLYSAAFGVGTTASGNYSTAIGNRTIASTNSSFALGTSNIDDPDAILMVGNGTAPVLNAPAVRNNAFVVKKDGDIVVDGEIQQTNTGSANMVPIAYGTVNGSANPVIVGGTGNFSITRNNTTNEYTISVTDQTLDLTNTVASVVSNTSNFRTANVTYSGGNMIVHIFISNGTKVASPFQFVIHKL